MDAGGGIRVGSVSRQLHHSVADYLLGEVAVTTPRRRPTLLLAVVLLTTVALAAGCGRQPEQSVSEPVALDLPTRYPAVPRLVVIGDLHGDLTAARAALRLAGALGEDGRWAGGDLVVVQLGDVFDRGGDELEILDLLDGLGEQARVAGGDVRMLCGNHEIMNARLDFRYVTADGLMDFAPADADGDDEGPVASVVAGLGGRIRAMRPGGPIALRLAERNVVAIVGDTVLVHGGLLPWIATGNLECLNQETRMWLRGETWCPPEPLVMRDGPLWSRHYSDAPDDSDCALLDETLERLNATRMVVGHTVQEDGISAACAERVWRVDVGMSAHYGGRPEVLEIAGERVRVLADEPAP